MIEELPVVGVTSHTCGVSLHCPLSKGATHIAVPGRGGASPRILFVIETLSKDDDKGNTTLSGEVGQYFFDLLNQAGLHPDDYYVVSLTQCISYKDGTKFSGKLVPPTQEVMTLCGRNHLGHDMIRFRETLKYVVPLGAAATKYFTGEDVKILSEAGKQHPILFDLPDSSKIALTVIPLASPSYALRSAATYTEKYLGMLRKIKDQLYQVENPEEGLSVHVMNPLEFSEYAKTLLEEYREGKIPYIAFDIETKSLEWTAEDAKFVGFCVCDPVREVGYFVGYEHPQFVITQAELDLVRNAVCDLVTTIPIVGHNILFDLKWVTVHFNLPINSIRVLDDTMFMGFYVLGAKRDTGLALTLKELGRFCLHMDLRWEDDLHKKLTSHRLKKDQHFWNVDFQTIATYGAYDAIVTYRLHQYFVERFKEVNRHGYDILLSSIPIFLMLETEGIAVDDPLRLELISRYQSRIDLIQEALPHIPTVAKFEQARREPSAGLPPGGVVLEVSKPDPDFRFNPSSTKQLAEILYSPTYYGHPVSAMTAGGSPSASEESLQNIATSQASMYATPELKKFVKLILEMRNLSKMVGTYLDGKIAEPSNRYQGMYLPDYKLTGTATGRISSFFHTLPSGNTDVKRLFVSRYRDQGGVVVAADYSQLEVRVIGALAQDANFIQAYRDGLDVHAMTASKIFNKPLDQVTKLERRSAKSVVFGILYGKQAKSLSEELGITMQESESMMNYFFEGFPNVKQWIDQQHDFLRRYKYVESVFGRRRKLLGIDGDKWSKMEAERAAQNAPIQSAASDLTFGATVRIQTAFWQENLYSRLMGTVHDSIEIDVMGAELFRVVDLVRYNMETYPQQAYTWLGEMPLRADFEIGASWGGACEIHSMGTQEDPYLWKLTGFERDVEDLHNLLRKTWNVELGNVEASHEALDNVQKFYDPGRRIDFTLRFQ